MLLLTELLKPKLLRICLQKCRGQISSSNLFLGLELHKWVLACMGRKRGKGNIGFTVVRPIVLTFISCFLTIIGSLYNKEGRSLYRLHEKKREGSTKVIGPNLNGLGQIYNGLSFWALLQFDILQKPYMNTFASNV